MRIDDKESNVGSDGSYGLSLQRREKGDQREVTVLGVDAGSVNEGIALPGDEILTIGGVNVRGNHRLVMEQLVANKGKPVKVEVLRRPDVAAVAASVVVASRSVVVARSLWWRWPLPSGRNRKGPHSQYGRS